MRRPSHSIPGSFPQAGRRSSLNYKDLRSSFPFFPLPAAPCRVADGTTGPLSGVTPSLTVPPRTGITGMSWLSPGITVGCAFPPVGRIRESRGKKHRARLTVRGSIKGGRVNDVQS